MIVIIESNRIESNRVNWHHSYDMWMQYNVVCQWTNIKSKSKNLRYCIMVVWTHNCCRSIYYCNLGIITCRYRLFCAVQTKSIYFTSHSKSIEFSSSSRFFNNFPSLYIPLCLETHLSRGGS